MHPTSDVFLTQSCWFALDHVVWLQHFTLPHLSCRLQLSSLHSGQRLALLMVCHGANIAPAVCVLLSYYALQLLLHLVRCSWCMLACPAAAGFVCHACVISEHLSLLLALLNHQTNCKALVWASFELACYARSKPTACAQAQHAGFQYYR